MDVERWRAFTRRALKMLDRADEAVTIAFVSSRRIKDLNKSFRGLDKPTDVLSFPAGGVEFAQSSELNLGDIAISIECAETQAAENGLEFDQEISQLILHGLLHLCGYDHETDDGEMNRLELHLRRRLGI
jgi:probable rRNA maturation factor